jgi:hypothetical protein
MPNELMNVVKKYAPVVLISVAVGAGIVAFATLDEEERPPIIVKNGSVDFKAAYGDSVHNDKGTWEEIGNSGKFRIKHDYLSGPNDLENEVYMGACNVDGWLKGPLKITYTDGTTSWDVDVHATGKYLQVDPQSGQPGTIDPKDKSHLTVGDPNVTTWITRVAQQGGTKYCTFDKTGSPFVRVRQVR